MSKIQDPDYLRNEQYKTPVNLNARINMHVHFSTNPYGWFRWVFDHYTFPENARILELGCGPGDLWLDNLERVPTGWQITLSDFSPGMLEKARQRVAEHPFNFEVIDAQTIPYSDDHFDIVIANHCLYHFPDRPKALSEIRRILKPDVYFFTTTIGEAHMRGLPELVTRFDPTIEDAFDHQDVPFTLENGAAQLDEWFADIQLDRYPDGLRVTESEPLADYVLSSTRLPLGKSRRDEFLAFVEAELAANNGVIFIHKDSGLFISRKE
jgi:SAM-dependent methyltransferase